VAAALTLRTTFRAAPGRGANAGDEPGTLSLLLQSPTPLPEGWRIALTSIVPLQPPPETARLVRRVATYHEIEPAAPHSASPSWHVDGIGVGHRPRHANDGPTAAFVILPDGSTIDADLRPMERAGGTPSRTAPSPPSAAVTDAAAAPQVAALIPMPRDLRVAPNARGVHYGARLADAPPAAASAWDAVAELAGRLIESPSLTAAGSLRVSATISDTLTGEAYRIHIAGDEALVRAGGIDGFRRAFVTLAQWAPAGIPTAATVEDAPRWTWRGLHVDLARRWYEPDAVARIIDLAAWRKLDRVHLHLTDDEAWRLPVAEWPELADVGGTRGHGLALPPMLGSGRLPYGRAYTEAEIAAWVRTADALGVVLVPEVDLPAHCHAALTARQDLRDPGDTSGARSVQDFVDNVVVPGLPQTNAFLTAVVDALANSFPTSPWLHIGGDEVPQGAWRGSPVVDAHRRARDLAATRDVEADFHHELVRLIGARTGRRVGAWQEAAQSGGVRPGDGYVVAWTSPDAARELAAAGHDVVVSPGQAYYLDMAPDDDWDTPGMSWAGTVRLEDTCDFEPGGGWTDEQLTHLVGVQACLWSEHVADAATFDRLAFPRLDAIAERAWTGRIDGGPASLRERAQQLPRLAVRAPIHRS
jgi:hexosaminidase